MKLNGIFACLKKTIMVLFAAFIVTNTAYAGSYNSYIDRVSERRVIDLLSEYAEAADIIGDNPTDPAAIEAARQKYVDFFTADAKVTVSGIEVIPAGTGQTHSLFANFVGRLFAHNGYHHTRHDFNVGPGLTIEPIEKGVFKLVSYVTADHYQGEGMFKIAARYEDTLVRTDRYGNPNPYGRHFRITDRSVTADAVLSINGGTFEMPPSVINP